MRARIGTRPSHACTSIRPREEPTAESPPAPSRATPTSLPPIAIEASKDYSQRSRERKSSAFSRCHKQGSHTPVSKSAPAAAAVAAAAPSPSRPNSGPAPRCRPGHHSQASASARARMAVHTMRRRWAASSDDDLGPRRARFVTTHDLLKRSLFFSKWDVLF